MEERIIALKSKLEKENVEGIALDIDETLSFTGGFWIQKIEEKYGVNPEGLSPQQIIKKYTVVQKAPYWSSGEILDWINEARETEEFYNLAPLIENANHFANKLNGIIPVVVYPTIRPKSVENVTKQWLERHGFPKAQVLTRPQDIEYSSGHKWKADVLDFLYPQVKGIVDDNPALLDFLPKDYKGEIFIYGSAFKYNGSLNVYVCETWEEVVSSASKVFSKTTLG